MENLESKNNKENLLLEVNNLKMYFPLQKNFLGKPQAFLRAVDNISFKLEAGKTIGVVGESGCGKTTLGRTILKLYEATGGDAIYYGKNVYEFLPKYYIKAIRLLPLTHHRINSLKKKIDSSTDKKEKYESEIDFIYNQNAKILGTYILCNNSLELSRTLLKKINQEKKLKANKNKINRLSSKIEKLSSNLQDKENINEKIEKLKTKLNQANENEKVLENEIDVINKKLASFKEEVQSDERFESFDQMLYKGLNLGKLTSREMRKLRVDVQLIFQDPYSSLPPRMTVGAIISEAVKVHKIVPKKHVYEYVLSVMKKCGLQPQFYDRYPHEFSGGQRQRICIARALAVNPKLVVCDEPVSALDVSIQAQIINLLKDLQNKLGLTYIFISHDLSVVKYITDRIMVMYLGNIMEIGDTKDIFANPLHPYTEALFSAVPVPNPDVKMNRIILKGDIPSPANPPKGCKFHTRCPKCMGVCEFLEPKFLARGENHFVCCHLYDDEVMNNRQKLEEEYQKKLEAENSNEGKNSIETKKED